VADTYILSQLDELLDALEPFVNAPEGAMSAPQAVAAMNHLKRLVLKDKLRVTNDLSGRVTGR